MKEAKERLSLRIPKDVKQQLRIAGVATGREITDIVIEAVNIWLIERREEIKKQLK